MHIGDARHHITAQRRAPPPLIDTDRVEPNPCSSVLTNYPRLGRTRPRRVGVLDALVSLQKVSGALWAGWLAQSAGLFSVPERDRGVRRVLIATPGDVAFWLPLFRLVVCMRAACHARGGRADVDGRITTGNRVATWSRRSDTSRS
ncbi:hypothetical protein Taro_033241 [Colocasia esculenta]|uniref:Uncharacterized protein n=1 Tax=Colocasia esculenta TaxID=4460 RepID=A0A843VXA4_COLES|nr:hypothetical protein [Colocasia esculenta]